MKLVKDYMKTKIRKVKPRDSIFKVAEIFSKYHISGAPVVRGKKVVGVITGSDIIRFMKLDLSKTHSEFAVEPHTISILVLALVKDQLGIKERLENLSKILAKDLMTREVIAIGPDESILEAATKLDEHKIERLPVVENGKLIGIISRSDLIRALLD